MRSSPVKTPGAQPNRRESIRLITNLWGRLPPPYDLGLPQEGDLNRDNPRSEMTGNCVPVQVARLGNNGGERSLRALTVVNSFSGPSSQPFCLNAITVKSNRFLTGLSQTNWHQAIHKEP